MKNMNKLIAAAAVVLITACGSTRPPRELQDARQAFQNARTTPGAELAPGDQREAKLALDRAEQEFEAEGDEQSTRNLAYVAHRKAVAARAHSEALQALQDKKIAQQEFDQFKAQRAMATAQELDRTSQELDRTKESLEESQARVQSERSARIAADEKLKQISDVQSKQTDRGLELTLSGQVLFASGKSMLLPRAQERLREVVSALKDYQRHITVVGHTDAQGKEDSNQKLSEARAKAVQSFLVKEGIPQDRIEAMGMGEAEPIADNDSPEGRANNRRVELVLQDKPSSGQPGRAGEGEKETPEQPQLPK